MSEDKVSGALLTRRTFLIGCAVAGGVLMIGVLPQAFKKSPAESNGSADDSLLQPNAFIRIDKTGTVTLILPYVEMGQGAYTSQVQLLAEELEVAPSSVIIEAAPPDQSKYGSPIFGEQVTGGSGSLRGSWASLRTAGAAARIMLINAASNQWKVPAHECIASDGYVIHTKSERKLGYGELTQAAALLKIPESPSLKKPTDYKLIGQSIPRVDKVDKVTGAAIFSIDVRIPDLRFAAVSACPVFNGKLANVDATSALKIKGVSQVVQLDDAVAVVANNTWAARKGLNALKIQWDEGENALVSTADLVSAADAALDRPGLVAMNEGDADRAEKNASSVYEATFRLPVMAHANLEPLSCTVHVRQGECEVWCGSQILVRAQKAAAEAAGLPLEKVTVHNQLLGGGFGRRLEVDFVSQAVLIAKQVDGPVKVTWSREEDTQHDYYRYHNHSRVKVSLDEKGRPLSWRHRVVGPNIMARWLPVYQKDGIDLDVIDQAHGPYDIPNVFIDFTRNEAPEGMHTGNWRGVGVTRNVFVVESVIDELAMRAGTDPIDYRRKLITKSPRVLATLEMAAEKANWSQPLPKGTGQGVAVFTGFGSYFSMIAKVTSNSDGLRIDRITCVADVGLAVNPDIVKAQLEGGIIYGLSAVLYGRITVAKGRVEQGNFDTYPVLRINEAPQIEVHLIQSDAEPGGVGEPGTSGTIAAVANAIFKATGVRLYDLPVDQTKLRAA